MGLPLLGEINHGKSTTAYGLRPIGLVGSGANSTGVTQYEIASNNTNAIFQYSICVSYMALVLLTKLVLQMVALRKH